MTEDIYLKDEKNTDEEKPVFKKQEDDKPKVIRAKKRVTPEEIEGTEVFELSDEEITSLIISDPIERIVKVKIDGKLIGYKVFLEPLSQIDLIKFQKKSKKKELTDAELNFLIAQDRVYHPDGRLFSDDELHGLRYGAIHAIADEIRLISGDDPEEQKELVKEVLKSRLRD
jgi:hypothetical protein